MSMNDSRTAAWLSGLRVLGRPLGQVTRPIVHQDTPAFEQVGTGTRTTEFCGSPKLRSKPVLGRAAQWMIANGK